MHVYSFYCKRILHNLFTKYVLYDKNRISFSLQCAISSMVGFLKENDAEKEDLLFTIIFGNYQELQIN